MMNLKRLVFSCALFLFVAHIASAADPDVAYQKNIIFDIRKNSNGLHYLTSTVKVQHSFLSKRSTRNNKIIIYEPFWAKVSKLKATFRDKPLKRKYRTTRLVDFKDIFISDDKVHTLRFPGDIRQGETAVFSYQQEYEDIAFLPIITIPNIDYVEAYHLIFKHPKTTHIDFEIFFSRKSIDYKMDRTNPRKTILSFNRLDYQKHLAYYPFNDFHAAILVTVSDNGQPVNPVKPKGFIDWYGGKVDLDPTFNYGLEDSLNEELISASSSLQKLKILYGYVQKNIRYIAVHRSLNAFTPREPSFTFEKSYGDCKDRAYLISALARHYNIDVDMALLSTEPTPPFKGLHVAEFNHVICAYYDGKQMLYFDPTSKYCEFGNLPECDIGTQVFILNPEKPRLEVIPAPNHLPSIEIRISGNLSHPENDSAVVVLRNDYFHQAIQAKTELTGIELENALSEMITSYLYKISLDNFQPIKEDGNSLTLLAKADLSHFIISSTTKKYIPKTAFLVIDKDIIIREADDFPIQLPSRNYFKMTIDLEVSGYEAAIGEFILGKEEGVFFSSSVSYADSNLLTILYDYRQPTKRFDFENKDRFIQFCTKYLKSKKEMFILRSTEL